MEQLFRLPQQLDYFALMFIRVSALLFVSPIFGRRNIPVMVRAGYCLIITILLFTAFPPVSALVYNNALDFIILCAMELAFGLVIGFVVNAFFQLTFTAGHIIDMQLGFGMVNVFDVESGIAVPIMGNFLNIVLILSFFMVNGHHQLIRVLHIAIQRIPLGQVTISASIASAALEVFVLAFAMAINVAMPILAAGILGEAAQGILMRTVPQMNLFVVGLPIKVLIGFIAMLIILPIYVRFTNTIFENMFDGIQKMFGGLSAAT